MGKIREFFYLLAIAVLISLSMIFIGAAFREEYPLWKNQKILEDLQSDVKAEETGDEDPGIDWEKLKKINPDIVGWIRVPGTRIDYPVLQGSRWNEYLHKNYKGESSYAGSIFIQPEASFEDKLTNIINYNFNGDFYQAQAIIGLVTDSEIESARIINPIGLAEFYTQKETTERNIQLMANGLPNEIEQQLADTRAYLDNAINLYNQGLYYEAADALSDFYLYRTIPALVDEYNQLVSDIKEQINYLPYRTLNDIRKMVENGDYYGAYARVNAFLEQGNLSDDVRNTAEILRGEIEDEIAAYERSQEVVGYRYVTNVANAVNFRQKPSASSTIITTIPYGTRIGYVEDANSEYARVKYDNMYGYVAKFYLSNYSPPKQYSAVRYVWRSGAVEMLDQPRSGAGIILTLAAETPVGLVEIVSDTYARVDYDGNQGYIRRDQLVLSVQ